jgi:glucose dehydrogenase
MPAKPVSKKENMKPKGERMSNRLITLLTGTALSLVPALAHAQDVTGEAKTPSVAGAQQEEPEDAGSRPRTESGSRDSPCQQRHGHGVEPLPGLRHNGPVPDTFS